jgi:ubiquinone/menaquinone biosynthesis C-methylase UbiE
MGLLAALRAPVSGVSDVWRANHPWASLYDFVVEHERLARVAWRAGIDSDVRRLYDAAEEIGRQPDGSAVLDIPCGGGVALRGLGPSQRIRYVAADIAPAMLERTRKEAERRGVAVELREADAGNLPFDAGSFDLAVCFTSLHCFPDPAKAVKELGRVLRPGGRITGSAFLTDSGLRFKPMIAAGRVGGLLGPSGTTSDLRRWLAWGGFEDVVLDRSGGLTYFTGRRG